MKFVRILVVVALAVSLLGNFVLWKRLEKNRMKIQINDKVITQRDFHNWLAVHHGRETLAEMVKYYLVKQAAEKAGLKPDMKEIEEALQDMRETNPRAAIAFKYRPWMEGDERMKLEFASALINLSTKDVRATDDEIKEFFEANRRTFDKQDKIYMKGVVCLDRETAEKAKQLMERVPDITVVPQQLTPKAQLIGADGTIVFKKPPGAPARDAIVNSLAAMKPNEVRIVPTEQGLLVVKMTEIKPGRKVTLEEVKDKVTRAFKVTRQKPPREVLRKLWDSATITVDDPALKEDIERLIFPERINQRVASQ